MREIKFRALGVDGKWRLGTHHPVQSDPYSINLASFFANLHVGALIPGTCSEYTGLKDRNGKEIYEGDLLKYPNGEIITVIWMVNPASFSPKEIDILHAPVIIGNVYENPELCKTLQSNGV